MSNGDYVDGGKTNPHISVGYVTYVADTLLILEISSADNHRFIAFRTRDPATVGSRRSKQLMASRFLLENMPEDRNRSVGPPYQDRDCRGSSHDAYSLRWSTVIIGAYCTEEQLKLEENLAHYTYAMWPPSAIWGTSSEKNPAKLATFALNPPPLSILLHTRLGARPD